MLREKFLEYMGVKGEIFEGCCLEMLYLCLVELSKEEGRDLSIEKALGLKERSCNTDFHNVLFEGYSTLLTSIMNIAGYWSNDIESAVLYAIKECFPESPVAECSTEAKIVNNNTVYDKIYTWLKDNYGLSFSF